MSDKAFLASLATDLHAAGAIKFGSFVLKSGITSPVYIDLRVLVGYPELLSRVAKALEQCLPHDASSSESPLKSFDSLCGVPYTALPFATIMSQNTGVPMLMRRREKKAYGTKKSIEGVIKQGMSCLVVEDIVTSGTSVWETVMDLQDSGVSVDTAVVLIDREQGGSANMKDKGITLHSVFTVSQLLDILVSKGAVDESVGAQVRTFIAANQVQIVDKKDQAASSSSDEPKAKKPALASLSYMARSTLCKSPVGSRLLRLMDEKKSNLCVAADVTTSEELLKLADAVGPHVCCVKTHCDIVSDWTADTAAKLVELANRHNFMVFEDRKFADIGNTVVQQCRGGVHKIATWADFVNAHILPGSGIVDGLRQATADRPVGLCLLAQMSSSGNLLDEKYTAAAARMAQENNDFVFGFICQQRLETCDSPDSFVYMTPGVKLSQGGDALGQQYNTPEHVIGTKGSDMIIVGRGIYAASDAAAAAQSYRDAGWKAYTSRLAQA